MANGFTRAIVLGPACTSRVLTTKPLLQLVWAHVDELIELSIEMLDLSSNHRVGVGSEGGVLT